jgi:hypothetical protein
METNAKQLELADSPKPVAEVTDLAGGILTVIARAASDPSVDVDKLARLLEMQERVLQREAERTYADAMEAAQAEMRPVVKNKANSETKSKYADLEAVSAAIDPIIYKHGFSLSFGTDNSELPGHYRVTCKVRHRGGHTDTAFADVPIDNIGPKGSKNKTDTHGFGSALSYGRRYLKLLIFDVATKDDDGNRAGNGTPVNAEQLAKLQTMIDNVGADTIRFCRHMKVPDLKSLPARRFEEAMKALEAKGTK